MGWAKWSSPRGSYKSQAGTVGQSIIWAGELTRATLELLVKADLSGGY